MTEDRDWRPLRSRAKALRASVLRTHPDDGPELYVYCDASGWAEVHESVDSLLAHIEEQERLDREHEDRMVRASPPSKRSPEEDALWDASTRLGSLSSAIRLYDDMLSGRKPVKQDTLILALAHGRDYFGDLKRKRDRYVRERHEIAMHLRASGFTVKKFDAYALAARALTR